MEWKRTSRHWFRRLELALTLGVAALIAPVPAQAAPASLTVTPDTALRFGSFVVITTGSRTVSASGAVTNSGIFPVGTAPVGPAQFTVTYDRGNNSPQTLSVTFQLVLGSVAPVSQAGVSGTLSGFVSDLPGAAVLVPGQVITITIPSCATRTCSRTFRVGARLNVTRTSGGAALTIALPVTATLISADRL
jgi:Domain of unknown function (DUF4402)